MPRIGEPSLLDCIIMSRPALLLCLLLTLCANSGCTSRKSAIVKITCTYHGASPSVMDSVVAFPVERAVMMANGVDTIKSLSTKGKTEVYVTCTSDRKPSEMLELIRRAVTLSENKLDPDASVTGIELLKPYETIPAQQPKMIDQLSVNIDLKKASNAGIVIKDIDRALASQDDSPSPTQTSIMKVSGLTIYGANGAHVRLGDVATVSIAKVPDVVIRSFP